MAILNVMDYGAAGDGVTDDAAAIRAAVDVAVSGDVVFVPAGDYRIGSTIYLHPSGCKLRGVGVSSILRLMDDARVSLLRLPIPPDGAGNLDPAAVADGVTIEKLTIDGNLNPYPDVGPGVTDYLGVYVQQATNLTIRRCLVRNWHSDAISLSNGSRPDSATIEDCRFDRVARNAIHVGFVSSCTIRRNCITRTPSQYWGVSAGNGIDVEVEGYDYYAEAPHLPYVRALTIEDNLLVLEPIDAASVGINLQPAYGPLSGVTVARNAIIGYQISVQTTGSLGDYGEVAGASDITIEDNWFGVFPGSATAGRPLQLQGCANVVASGNVMNDTSDGGDFSESGTIEIKAASDVEIIDNLSWGSDQVPGPMVLLSFGTDLASITGNSYRCASGLAAYNDGTATNITATGNTDLVIAGAAWDSTPPVVTGLSVGDGDTISQPVDIVVSASDAGSGVARVYFFVDGIPSGHSDAAPHTFAFDPADYADGSHVLSARALDHLAVLGDEVSVGVVTVAGAVETYRLLWSEGNALLWSEGNALLWRSGAIGTSGSGILAIYSPQGGILLFNTGLA